MNRARRTGVASRHWMSAHAGKTLHLAITVAAIERGRNSGFVVVIEDTQRSAAGAEVARPGAKWRAAWPMKSRTR